jgi:HD-GYP domain-containing protein (c-di-GMP phosphodiesterase class II)
MKTIKVAELKPGMRFSAPVYIEGESLLVPENIELKEKDIERLKRWGIPEVETEGDIVSSGAADSAEVGGEVNSEYANCVSLADDIFLASSEGKVPEKETIDSVVNTLFTMMKQKPDELLGPMFQPIETKHSLSKSSINCVILSVLIGQHLKLPNHQLLNLAYSALLHDIGMTRIPKKILEKNGELSSDEMQRIKTHPIYTYRVITRDLGYSDEVGKTALYHHERWDGKGYPKGLSGKNIPLTARILSVVDAYEAMVNDRPYRSSMIGYRAMRQILNDNSRSYDSDILKVFLKSMGIYPVGSIVILNDGSVAKVKRNRREVPLRPIVQLLVSGSGNRLPKEQQKEIDLYNNASYFIAKAVSPGEMNRLSKTG